MTTQLVHSFSPLSLCRVMGDEKIIAKLTTKHGRAPTNQEVLDYKRRKRQTFVTVHTHGPGQVLKVL